MKTAYIGLIISLILSIAFLSPAFSLDGKRVIYPESVFSAFLNTGMLYEQARAKLMNLDKPENDQTREMLTKAWETAKPNFLKARTQAKSKVCAANMRVLLSAAEMYNMDHPVMMTTLSMPQLRDEKYFKDEMVCPENGTYSSTGDLTSGKGNISCSIHKTVDTLVTPEPRESGGFESISFPQAVKAVLDFDSKAIFIPKGGLWLSMESGNTPILVLEASVKPKEFADFLMNLFPQMPKPSKAETDLVIFSLPSLTPKGFPYSLQIKPDGLEMAINHFWRTVPAGWEDFLSGTGPETLLIVDLDGEKLKTFLRKTKGKAGGQDCSAQLRGLTAAVELYNMDHPEHMKTLNIPTLLKEKYLVKRVKCPNGGEYGETGDLSDKGEVKCSIHQTAQNFKSTDGPLDKIPLPDPRLESLTRARIFIGKGRIKIGASFGDSGVREELKRAFTEAIQSFKGMIRKQGDPLDKLVLGGSVPMADRLKVYEKETWVGIALEGSEPTEALTALIGVGGVLAAIAAPNFKKARDEARDKACYANMRVLYGAVEMYKMDNQEGMNSLDIGALVKGNYLRSPPTCPEGGAYSMEATNQANPSKIPPTLSVAFGE